MVTEEIRHRQYSSRENNRFAESKLSDDFQTEDLREYTVNASRLFRRILNHVVKCLQPLATIVMWIPSQSVSYNVPGLTTDEMNPYCFLFV